MANSTLGDYTDTDEIILGEVEVGKIPRWQGAEFVEEYHYTGGCSNSAMFWGAFHENELIGVIAFATPISENVRKSVFEKERCFCDHIEGRHGTKQHVTELHRLATTPSCPQNTESWLISRGLDALKEYKPKYKAVVTFADTTEGHTGTIYQATNAIYYGTSGTATFYRDTDGRLRSPRQCGENITKEQAQERGWETVERDAKHRYLYLLPDPYESKSDVREMVSLSSEPYP